MKLLLIDTMGLLYRGHYALIRSPLTAPDGTVTSGIMHVANEVFAMYDRYKPDNLAAVLDYPAPSFRKDIYPEYKANRPPMPFELKVQSNIIRELLPVLGIPIVEHNGLEADDLIASLTEIALKRGGEVIILSSDKDLLQLVEPRVMVFRPGRRGRPGKEIHPENVKEEIGVRADQIVDYLALTGDSSDNIPGARGIGPRTATGLIDEFGSIEALYDGIDRIKSNSTRKKLIESRDRVDLSRKLVTLNKNLPEGISISELRLNHPDSKNALCMLERLGLRKLMKRIKPEKKQADIGVNIVRTSEKLNALESTIGPGPISLDTETTSKYPIDADTIGISLTNTSKQAWYLPIAGEDALPEKQVITLLRTFAETRGMVAQNAKYDLHILSNMGIHWNTIMGDPFIADYVLRPAAASRSLSSLSLLYLGEPMMTYSDVLGDADSLLGIATEKVAEYCCSDSTTAWKLNSILDKKLAEDPALENIYRNVELPLIPVLMKMERRGVALDMESLRELKQIFAERLEELSYEACEIAEEHINLGSPAQVSRILFEKLGLESKRKTSKGAFSSSMTVLEALAGQHCFVDIIIEHREISKLQNTYVAKLPGYVSPRTGLIHTSFNQAVTSTGRLSSSNPNLQNIPIRTRRGRLVRKCFLPAGDNEVFVSADYSQIELRVLAHLAGPGVLREAYDQNSDIHNATAQAVFGDTSPEHRRKAKEVNFSIIYGISPYGLSQRLGVSRGEASGIINRYFATYPEVDIFFRKTVTDTEATGETRTILGRRRDFPELATAKGNARRSIERVVMNTVVQGSAADIVKLAMLGVHRKLKKDLPEAGLVLQVHDELVISCPENQADQAMKILKQEMENAMELAVPLRIEAGKGRNWLEAQH